MVSWHVPLLLHLDVTGCHATPQEESARAAVLLEQSAYCLLFTSPPSVRKFAFHMVLAALRYNSAGFKRLGLHAYRYG